MNKKATDFALMAGAFSKDHKMAAQVCRLLADGDVDEMLARKMLRLVMGGKLVSEQPYWSHRHWYSNGTWTVPITTSSKWDGSSTLTTMAQTISKNAARH